MLTAWFQVHLLSFNYKSNVSLFKWAIFPDESADYISNTTAMVMLDAEVVLYTTVAIPSINYSGLPNTYLFVCRV